MKCFTNIFSGFFHQTSISQQSTLPQPILCIRFLVKCFDNQQVSCCKLLQVHWIKCKRHISKNQVQQLKTSSIKEQKIISAQKKKKLFLLYDLKSKLQINTNVFSGEYGWICISNRKINFTFSSKYSESFFKIY